MKKKKYQENPKMNIYLKKNIGEILSKKEN